MRLLRKPVVVYFVGSDARPPYINGAMQGENVARMARQTRRTKRRVRRMERGASLCINAPGTAHFHERPVVNWFAIGFPRSVHSAGESNAAAVAADATSTPVVRLLHSPSQPLVKGTAQIEAAVDRLRQRGLPLELRTISGFGNAEVIQALRECDLVLDQLYSDTPMAGFATEAAQMGKPALVGGYFASGMPNALGGQAVPPTCFVAPADFEAALERLARDGATRHQLGQAAFGFVANEWACENVAARVLRLIEGDVPAAWWFNPAEVNYLAGCGLSEDQARERVWRLLDHGGVQALSLADKPALQAAFVAWAGAGPAVHGEPA